MNIYNILNIKHLSTFNFPSADIIENTLNKIVTPVLEELELRNNKYKYIWEGEYNSLGIKNIIRFSYRGSKGNLTIGKNFKFIPILNNKNEIKYKTNEFHLFEFIEYFDDNVGISLWNSYFFKKTLKRFIKNEINKIRYLFSSTNDIQGNIEMILRQLKNKKLNYETHFPSPKYVLAFLYVKNGEKEKGKAIMKEYMKENFIDNPKLLLILDEI